MAESNYFEEKKIPKRILSSLINSLSAGVVPRTGVPYIAIGRNDEIKALLSDLEIADSGGCTMRFIIGRYGSGKSFLMQLIRSYALERGFLTSDCDLSPERKICGGNGYGIATYRELMKNLSSKVSPEGGALAGIISRWLSDLQSHLAAEGFEPDSQKFVTELQSRIYSVVSELEGQVGGFDFATVINTYYKAYTEDNEELKSAALRWIRGEFNTKTEAKQVLHVGSIINDENWFEYVKLFAVFTKKIGYRGFVLLIDECVNLYKISNRISRESNYEKLLSMFNDALGGRSPGLSVIMGGTPQFLEDTRRGLFSYEALHSRLADGQFNSASYKNTAGPVIRLRRLSDNELYALIERITYLYSLCYGCEIAINDTQKADFLKICLSKAGADSHITPREILRDYITVMDILRQNDGATFESVIGSDAVKLVADNSSAESDDFTLGEIDI